jgi:hypothetical protein
MREVLNISRNSSEVLLEGETDNTIKISEYLSGPAVAKMRCKIQ